LPVDFRALNPNFDTGALRRRTRSIATSGRVQAGVEDSYHSFRLTLSHDEHEVSRIETRALRHPLDTCLLASEPLQKIYWGIAEDVLV